MDFSKLSQNVQKGNARMTNKLVQEALADGIDASVILNKGLIPALNEVGIKFKNNEIYVPEMLLAGKAMTAGIKVLEPLLSLTGAQFIGTAVIGTVKGDIHDIGKNIVKVLLENYGYEVIDLGKDVPPEKIVETVVDKHAPLVGLSALMTTTVVNMEESIKELHKEAPWCKIMVGGAVLTQEYADMIGADFYGKDAMQSVYYAERLLNS